MLNKAIVWGLVAYMLLYAVFLFLDLTLIPLVWIDEIMGLDPGYRLTQGKGMGSYLWPQDGAEEILLAYLPAQPLLHALHQSILPFDVFWVRLPWAIYLLLGAVLLYLIFKRLGLSMIVAIALVILTINERSLFETTRGVRIEPFIFLVIVSAIYSRLRKWFILQSTLASCLVFSHPNIWPMALLLYGDAVFSNYSTVDKPLVAWRPFIVPIIFISMYLVFIDFRVDLFLNQFVNQGSDHAVTGSLAHRFQSHFIDRFWPYYLTQPWIPLLVYGALVYAIYLLWKKQNSYLSIGLILTHVVWFTILGPYPRYNSILVVLSLLLVIPVVKNALQQRSNLKYVLLCAVILSAADVAGRHAMARIQKAERDPYPVLTWLDSILPKGESYLISGNEIAYYAATPSANGAYFLHNMPPYKYDFSDFKNYYLLLDDTSCGCYPVAEYSVQVSQLSERVGKKTYENMYLLDCKNEKKYSKALQILDSASREEMSRRH